MVVSGKRSMKVSLFNWHATGFLLGSLIAFVTGQAVPGPNLGDKLPGEAALDKIVDTGGGNTINDNLKNLTVSATRRRGGEDDSSIANYAPGGLKQGDPRFPAHGKVGEQYDTVAPGEGSGSYEEEEDDGSAGNVDTSPVKVNGAPERLPQPPPGQRHTNPIMPPNLGYQQPVYKNPTLKQVDQHPRGNNYHTQQHPPQYYQRPPPQQQVSPQHYYPQPIHGGNRYHQAEAQPLATGPIVSDLNALNTGDERNRTAQYESSLSNPQRNLRGTKEGEEQKKHGKRKKTVTKWVPVQVSLEYDDEVVVTTANPEKKNPNQKKKIVKMVPVELSVEEDGRLSSGKPGKNKKGSNGPEDEDEELKQKKNDKKRKTKPAEGSKEAGEVEVVKIKKKPKSKQPETSPPKQLSVEMPTEPEVVVEEQPEVEEDDTSTDDNDEDNLEEEIEKKGNKEGKDVIKLISVEVSDEDGNKRKDYAFGRKDKGKLGKKPDKAGKKKGKKKGGKKKNKKGKKVEDGLFKYTTKKPKATTTKSTKNDNNNWNLLGLMTGR